MIRIPTGLETSDDKTVYPLMWMASMEPVKIRKEKFIDVFPLNFGLFDQIFSLHFSATKKEKDASTKLTYVITSLNLFLPPELLTMEVNDVASDQAKQFLINPLNNFYPFKKAILLFENKSYMIQELEQVVTDWKKDLEEKIK